MIKSDICGRWKTKAHVSDIYKETELPYPDAKVAEKLSIGGLAIICFMKKSSAPLLMKLMKHQQWVCLRLSSSAMLYPIFVNACPIHWPWYLAKPYCG
jgi:hypothetical protein